MVNSGLSAIFIKFLIISSGMVVCRGKRSICSKLKENNPKISLFILNNKFFKSLILLYVFDYIVLMIDSSQYFINYAVKCLKNIFGEWVYFY